MKGEKGSPGLAGPKGAPGPGGQKGELGVKGKGFASDLWVLRGGPVVRGLGVSRSRRVEVCWFNGQVLSWDCPWHGAYRMNRHSWAFRWADAEHVPPPAQHVPCHSSFYDQLCLSNEEDASDSMSLPVKSLWLI